MYSLHGLVCRYLLGHGKEKRELQRLLEDGELREEVNKLDHTHTTPLGYCVQIRLGGDEPRSAGAGGTVAAGELVALLLKHGADPDLKDGRGWTLLHHAAWAGDLSFIRTCRTHGKGDIKTVNSDGRLAVDLAAAKGYAHVTHYLDTQSCDLRFMCRAAIRQALEKRCGQLDKLLLPQRLKLFLNYNIPYRGFSAVLVPPEPWTTTQLFQNEVEQEEVREFIRTHASEEFLSEHSQKLEDRAVVVKERRLVMEELASLFQEMYLWEAFKNVKYEEPLARPPRYSLQKCTKKLLSID